MALGGVHRVRHVVDLVSGAVLEGAGGVGDRVRGVGDSVRGVMDRGARGVRHRVEDPARRGNVDMDAEHEALES